MIWSWMAAGSKNARQDNIFSSCFSYFNTNLKMVWSSVNCKIFSFSSIIVKISKIFVFFKHSNRSFDMMQNFSWKWGLGVKHYWFMLFILLKSTNSCPLLYFRRCINLYRLVFTTLNWNYVHKKMTGTWTFYYLERN